MHRQLRLVKSVKATTLALGTRLCLPLLLFADVLLLLLVQLLPSCPLPSLLAMH
jgi:hypothetical protein